MTLSALFCSLHAARSDRCLFNGRRWSFLNSVAHNAARYCLSQRCSGRALAATHLAASPHSEQTNNASPALYCSKSVFVKDTEFSVDISTQGTPLKSDSTRISSLATSLQEDAVEAVLSLVSWHQTTHNRFLGKELIELSLTLSDDSHIQQLNKKHLNADRPTDVLSFPMDGDEEDEFPVMLLGDIVLSLDTANRQASGMGHSLLTECRILIVHALLHLFGYDHDRSDQAWTEMAQMERQTLASLGWEGNGLISNAKRLMLGADLDPSVTSASTEDSRVRNASNIGPLVAEKPTQMHTIVDEEQEKVQLVAIDLDGTMLTSDQRITDASKDAIQEALLRGIQVVVATGKARPGAIACCQKYGLYGTQNLISHHSAGIFLQGLVVHTVTGEPLAGPDVPSDVVRSAFQYASETGVSCVAFTGDECITLHRTADITELHERYYEPLAKEVTSIETILYGPPVKKIILVADPEDIKREIQPHWVAALDGTSSKTTLSVSKHLELLPRGVDKWVGLTSLMQSMNVSFRSCMAIGDGINDYEMVKHAAVGVAMGNAVSDVKAVADHVVASNDEDGIAEAFQKLIFS